MISSINGFSPNFTIKDVKPNLASANKDGNLNGENATANSNANISKIDYDNVNPDDLTPDELKKWADAVDPSRLSEKDFKKLLSVKMGFTDIKKGSSISDSQDAARKTFSLSGYTSEGEISVWGKLSGLDKSMSKDEVENLKKFVDSVKILGIGMFGNLDGGVLSVDKVNHNIIKDGQGTFGLGIIKNLGGILKDESLDLLDSGMSVEEFKKEWLDYAIRKRAELEIKSEFGENKDVRSDKEKFRFIKSDGDVRTYVMEMNGKKYYLNISLSHADSAEKISDTLDNIREFISQKDADKFKPIQAKSQSATYKDDINREFFLNFLKAEIEKGNDVTKILEEFRKIKKTDISI